MLLHTIFFACFKMVESLRCILKYFIFFVTNALQVLYVELQRQHQAEYTSSKTGYDFEI